MRAPLREAIEDELRSNLAPFWRERSLDREHGGFIAEMDADGRVRDAAKGLVLNARLLWTFSALYRRYGEPRDLELARRAYAVLENDFRDPEHGGYVWRIDAERRVLDATKKVYGQAFCVYALSEYALATGDASSLDEARSVFELLERHAHDPVHGGYLEARASDWSATTDLRLSEAEPDDPKSMNTHLHVLEAYTNLYRAWPAPAVAARLRELIGVFTRHILGAEGSSGAGHLRHFFGEAWDVRSRTYTYGHDIEASWLLGEAAEVLGDAALAKDVRDRGTTVATRVLDEGLGPDGGIAYEGRDGKPVDGKRDWWCQAEAVVGFWNAYENTGDVRFADAAEQVWGFISGRLVDRAHGDWYWGVRADGTVDRALPKVSEWKCPYHSVRMCLEMTRRLTDGKRGAER